VSLMWPKARIAVLPDRVAVADGRAYAEATGATLDPDGLTRALAEALAATRCKGRVEVVLSHALAPVWLLTMPALRLDWVETLGWAREQLTGQLGERIGRCRLAFQPVPPGEPLLVSALDAEWLIAMTATLASQGVVARSVEPWLTAAVQRRQGKLRRGANWLALAEAGRLTLAYFQDGQPRAVRSQQVSGDMVAALADAVRREALLAGVSERAPVWLETGVRADWRASGLDVQLLRQGEGAAKALIGD
jgi:hypothetical protein